MVKPDADPEMIEVAYEGSEGIEIESGELIIDTAIHDIIEAAPYSYQGNNKIESSYKLLSANSYGFTIGDFNAEEELVIDPLIYSTYIGGGHQDYTTAIDVDSSGNAYVTGSTWYTTIFPALPTTPGAYSTTHNGGVVDSFVVKLNSTGAGLVYSTFMGGSSGDDGFAITVDSTGNAYVAGRTQSSNFPTTSGAFDTTFAGTDDAFISKLSANGSSLIFSTYLGGSGDDEARDIAVDSNGNVFMTGFGQSGFPTTIGAYDVTFNGGSGLRDAVAVKLNSSGSSLDFSTYLGGKGHDAAVGIAFDTNGNAYVAGETESNDFPNTTGALDNDLTNYRDAFVTKINPTGTALVYSTYLGGSSSESAEDIAVDSNGNAYVTGLTSSADFHNTTGAFDNTYNGNNDVYLTKLNSAGSAVTWSTFIGGTGQDWGREIELGSDGSIYVAAAVLSSDFPVTADAYNNVSNGGQDVVVMKMKSDGSSLLYSTYFGGTSHDGVGGMVWDDAGNIYLTGSASTTGFPITAGAYDTNQSNGDGYISKLFIGVTSGPATNDTCIDTAEDMIDYLDGMDPSDFSNPNHQKTLKNKMNAVIKQIKNGSYCSAANKLENDILRKLDGEHPPPDWVTDPVAQQDLEDMVLEMIDCLRAKGGCP
jgi:hypothetical protein